MEIVLHSSKFERKVRDLSVMNIAFDSVSRTENTIHAYNNVRIYTILGNMSSSRVVSFSIFMELHT